MKDYRALLNMGATVSGAAAGAAISTLASDTVGAVVGAATSTAATEVFKAVLGDMANRYLSPREEQRVGGVAALAVEGIRESLLWKARRDDAFFDRDLDGPSPAEELFEGVLLSAKQEHEHLKLPYLANFYTNLVFTPDVTKHEANYFLTLAEALTYRQFCILSLVDQLNDFELRRAPWEAGVNIDPDSFQITQQALYLYQRQLIVSFNRELGYGANIYEARLLIPARAIISGPGVRLSSLLGLHKIPKSELLAIAAAW